MKIRKTSLAASFALLFIFWSLADCASALLTSKDAVALEPDKEMAGACYENETEEQLLDDNLVEFAEYFSRPRLVKLLSNSRKVILTFDDGPHPRTTPKILEILRKRNIRAIFFVLGLQAEKYPDLLRQIAQDGHEIGNHSYNHPNLTQLSEDQIRYQIDHTNSIISSITGTRPRFLRPPYGALNKQVLRLCQTENMNIMLWTIDPKDWQNKNEAMILNNLSQQLGLNGNLRGGAVLLHDIYPATVRALAPFLDKLAVNEYIIANASNFTETSMSQFWAAISPKLSRDGGFRHEVDPAVFAHPLLTNLIGEKEQTEISSMGMLKANRNNELLVFLARQTR